MDTTEGRLLHPHHGTAIGISITYHELVVETYHGQSAADLPSGVDESEVDWRACTELEKDGWRIRVIRRKCPYLSFPREWIKLISAEDE